jgi:hypothetical protein
MNNPLFFRLGNSVLAGIAVCVILGSWKYSFLLGPILLTYLFSHTWEIILINPTIKSGGADAAVKILLACFFLGAIGIFSGLYLIANIDWLADDYARSFYMRLGVFLFLGTSLFTASGSARRKLVQEGKLKL